MVPVYFVYRSHYEGLLSKRVRHTPDETVLDWFRRVWNEPDPDDVTERELGGYVYGFTSILEAPDECHDEDETGEDETDEDEAGEDEHDSEEVERLPVPQTWQQLNDYLVEYLYVEGELAENLRFDGRSLRVKTDDDEVDLAYMFVEDSAAAPERWAYLLHDEWPLPSAAHDEDTVAAQGKQPRTHAVFLTFQDGGSLDLPGPVAFDGIRLPELADRLRSSGPDERAGWPRELQLLCAMVQPGDEAIADAVQRANRWPGFDLNSTLPPTAMLDVPADHNYAAGRDPGQSRIEATDHIVQMAIHCSEPFGYQQWFLFDDVWAAAYPALAASLLRYATHWDPLE